MTEKKEKNVGQNCTSATVLINLNISINSRPIDFKFCMVPNLTKLNEPKYEKPNQTNPNQTKPNQTITDMQKHACRLYKYVCSIIT